uniref:Elongator complex protein 2 n=1 Tax=Chlamydomonas euryale TaxID=1486919 RepID=A0A6U2IET4_9CHLO|mmetsp:Transcript_42446/g.127242  ORF Transcript_42446/g.127242 Transcript_42446/m.127242 type:complete len:129 (+) Transcript_42446:326-712(+)
MPGGGYTDGPDFAPCAAPAAVDGPPLEEHLAQNTLWPEVHKLYGHGNDVYCLAVSRDGRYAASACVAKSASAAEIWVWAVASWRGVAQLAAHTLTVTSLAWSHNDRYLAACSRDRSFSVFRRGGCSDV